MKDLSSGETFDPIQNSWSPLVPMGTKRSCLGVCALNSLVYASGGYDGAACLDSVERYDPLADSWTSIHVMNTKRRYHKLVALSKRSILSSKILQATESLSRGRQIPRLSCLRSSSGMGILALLPNGSRDGVEIAHEALKCLNCVFAQQKCIF